MSFTDYLEKIISIEDQILGNKPRIVNTLQYADRVITACLDASTGDTERKIFGDLKTIADKALAIVS